MARIHARFAERSDLPATLERVDHDHDFRTAPRTFRAAWTEAAGTGMLRTAGQAYRSFRAGLSAS